MVLKVMQIQGQIVHVVLTSSIQSVERKNVVNIANLFSEYYPGHMV